ncbi:MAG: hypothetical protein ACYDHH_34725, partial [Solirubrobacteraceae bacterium]
SKEALIDELFSREFEARVLDAGHLAMSGLPGVLAIADRLQELASEDPHFLAAMFALSFEVVHHGTPLRSRLADWLTRLELAIAEGFAAGLRDGSVDPGVDPSDAARDVLAAGAGLAFLWTSRPELVDLDHELQRFRDRIHAAATHSHRNPTACEARPA